MTSTAIGLSLVDPFDTPAPAAPAGDLAAVYRYAVGTGAVRLDALDDVARSLELGAGAVLGAVARLLELHMLRTDGSDTLVPTDAAVAAELVVSPIEREIYRRRELADRLRDSIDGIAEAAGPLTDPSSARGIDTFRGADEVSGLLKTAAGECVEEVVVFCPDDGESGGELGALLERCLPALPPTAQVRLLYPHRARVGFASRSRARRLLEGGAQVRTVSHVSQAWVVFDRSVAVVLSNDAAEVVRPAARRLRNADVATCLVDLFDQLWDGAAAYVVEENGYADGVADDLQRCIARLLAQGLTDEVVARRLGVSVRTCRRHIAALLRNLDSVSRFQAGVHAARHLDIDAPVA